MTELAEPIQIKKMRKKKTKSFKINDFYIKAKEIEIVESIIESDKVLSIKGFKGDLAEAVIPSLLERIKNFLKTQILSKEDETVSFTQQEIKILKSFVQQATPKETPIKKIENIALLSTEDKSLQKNAVNTTSAYIPEDGDLFRNQILESEVSYLKFPFLVKIQNNANIMANVKSGPGEKIELPVGDILQVQGLYPVVMQNKQWLSAISQKDSKIRVIIGYDSVLRM